MLAISRLNFPSRLHFPRERIHCDLCPKNNVLWGVEELREIRSLSPHRIIAIEGLNLDCIESIYRDLYSDDGLAMAGGLMAEDDPYLTAQKIQAIREKIR